MSIQCSFSHLRWETKLDYCQDHGTFGPALQPETCSISDEKAVNFGMQDEVCLFLQPGHLAGSGPGSDMHSRWTSRCGYMSTASAISTLRWIHLFAASEMVA